MFCNVFRSAAGPTGRRRRVHLEHGPSENIRDIEKAFARRCCSTSRPMRGLFGRGVSGAMPQADARGLQLLFQLTGLGLRSAPPSFIERIRMTIRDNLATRPVDLPMVSEVLAVPVWTLRRRLAERRPASPISSTRCPRTGGGLSVHSALQIGQLSERLGYAEISAFTRAFKRWHDVSPAQYRKSRGGCRARRGDGGDMPSAAGPPVCRRAT